MRGSPVDSERVVAKQDFGIARGNGAERPPQIVGAVPDVVDPDHPQSGRSMAQHAVRVAEHVDVLRPKRVRYLVGIHVEVVVAEDRKDAQPRSQSPRMERCWSLTTRAAQSGALPTSAIVPMHIRIRRNRNGEKRLFGRVML